MNEIGWPLWVRAITKVGLPGRNGTDRQHIQQVAVIVAVDLEDGEAERGRLLIKRLEVVGLRDCGSLLEPVAVHDDGEPVQLVVGGGHHGLPVAALLQLTVTDEHVRAAPGDVQLGRQRVADRDRQAVPERSGIGLDAATLVRFGWPLSVEAA